jgi:hypothetical protein
VAVAKVLAAAFVHLEATLRQLIESLFEQMELRCSFLG